MILQRAIAGISSLKLWSRHGFPSDHLLQVYTPFTRSCLEYCSPVPHYGLTQEQSSGIERVQCRTLLIVSKATKVPYCALLEHIGLDSLASRRQKLSIAFDTWVLNQIEKDQQEQWQKLYLIYSQLMCQKTDI